MFLFSHSQLQVNKKEMNIDTVCLFLNWYGISLRRKIDSVFIILCTILFTQSIYDAFNILKFKITSIIKITLLSITF